MKRMTQLTIGEALRVMNARNGTTINYHQLWRAIADGAIPAERGPKGKSWRLEERDLPAIFAHLTAKSPAQPSK
jgi:hypothetical protein